MRIGKYVSLVITLFLMCDTSRADFKCTQQSKVTGGALVGMTKTLGVFSKNMRQVTEPQTSTTMLQGNRLREERATGEIEIIDLDDRRFIRIGADAYVTGALRKVGPTQLRLDVRVQDTGTGQILFSDKLDGQDVQSIFGMVNRLTASIAGKFLPASELPQRAPEIEQASSSDVEAYRHYQLGMDYGRRFQSSEAAREFGEAVRLDPQFALAYMRLADLFFVGGDLRQSKEMIA